VLLYGAEAWTILKEDERRLQAFHMRCQRRILGIRWYDFVTNAAVSTRTSLPNICSTIARRRHALFGHVRRLFPSAPAHKALYSAVLLDSGGFRPDPAWRRPLGRPRRTWISQLTQDTGLSANQLWSAADDMAEWEALRPTAGSRS